LQAAASLLGEILEEQSVHRAFQADVKLADFAFGQRHGRHSGEAHSLEEARNILLVAADTIESFRINGIKFSPACILHERLDAWP
jgi:hypothetical protein